MAEFVGVVLSLLVMAVLFLPLLTFLRLARVSRDIEELAARVADLEGRAAGDIAERRAARDAAAQPESPTMTPPMPGAAVSATPSPTVSTPPSPATPPPPPFRASDGTLPQPQHASVPGRLPTQPPVGTDEDLEERIGRRGLLYTGVLVLLLGISFFLKYAFDNAWINETARAVLGAVVGATLIAGGLRMSRQGLATFGQALVGTGLAVLYLVVYASLNFYDLIDRGAAFVLMLGVTAAAATLAHRERAQALAFIAVGGGFLTPALVGGDENAQLTLFSYAALLVLGTMLLSFRHQWLALNALSYVGTFLTVVAWAGRFYTADQWLRTLLFLTLFCVAFLIILREMRQMAHPSARAVAGLLSTAPVFYHIAALAITAGHPPAIHIYLIAFTAAGLWLTAEPHRPSLRLAVLLGAYAPMLGAWTLPGGRSWLMPNLVTAVAVALLHVVGLLDRTLRQSERLRGADFVLLHATGLGLFALLYDALQPVFPGLRGALAWLLALMAGALAHALRPRDAMAALNAVALAFTLVAIGIGVQFDGATVIIGWSAEAVGLVWLGVSLGSRAFQFGGLALWLLAAVHLFDTFSETPATFVALVNSRTFATIFVVVTGYVMAWRLGASPLAEAARVRLALHIIGSALTLGWITAEIESFWEVRADRPQAYLYEQMLLSLAWAIYGASSIVVGMLRAYPPLRYIGMVVIAGASLKLFFYDLWELGGIYRVVGFIAFGVLLLLVSYLYQSRRATPPAAPAEPSS